MTRPVSTLVGRRREPPERPALEAQTFEQLPDWLTPAQLMRFLHLSRSATYEALRSGVIPSRKFGRLYRIPKAAVRPQIGAG